MHEISFDLRKPLVIQDNKFKVDVFVDIQSRSQKRQYDGWVNFTRKNIIHIEIPELGQKYTIQSGKILKENT